MAYDLAITPGGRVGDASPLGKKGGKRKLSDYEREVAHALIEKRGIPKERAIPMARGIIDKAAKTGRWGRGKKASPSVRAGAVASVAQRKSFSNEVIEVDFSFNGKKAAPFKKGGGRKKSHPNDAHGNPRKAQAKALATKLRGTDARVTTQLSNTRLTGVDYDLAPKWKHGFIPLNAEAVAIKEHKAKGKGPESGKLSVGDGRSPKAARKVTERKLKVSDPKNQLATSKAKPKLANGQKYHSAATKMKMTQTDLREHANQHAQAAGRAKSVDSKLKHVREAQASLDEIQRRKDAKKPTVNKPKVKPSSPEKKPKVAKPKADENPLTERPKLKMTDKLSHTELLKEIKQAKASNDKLRLTQLKREVAHRQKTALQITEHAAQAKSLIEDEWDTVNAQDQRAVKRFFAKIAARAPFLKKPLAKVAASKEMLASIREKEKFKKFVDACADEYPRVLLGIGSKVALGFLGSGVAGAAAALFGGGG